jgi:16S rRNA (cytosine1402-N4)-methyltransferase
LGRHQPVLPAEVLEALAIRKDGIYLDATFGRGGHSLAILGRLGRSGRLFAMDRDPDAVAFARELANADPRFQIRQGPFSEIAGFMRDVGVSGRVDGILFDLGVSSPQLDDPSRGFSFSHDGPLDMRMDNRAGTTAAEWLAHADEKEIVAVLRHYGEEPHARRIANAIVAYRADRALTRTSQLADIVTSVVRRRPGAHHPATRTFQALRIFINRELEELRDALAASLDILGAGGRLVVISFHSLEDRIAKRFMRDHARPDPVYAGLPDMPASARPSLALVGKPRRADAAETESNPRSRSAILRVAERL